VNTILAGIANKKIAPILIGGQAAVFHGLCDRSIDWDFVVDNTDAVKEEIRNVLCHYAFRYKFVNPGELVSLEPLSMSTRQNLRFTSEHCDLDFIHALDFVQDHEIGHDLGKEMWYNDLVQHSTHQIVNGIEMLVLNDYAVVLSKMVRSRETDILCRSNYLTKKS
jgi:hypothetical protein